LVGTERGDRYSENDMSIWLNNAEFSDIQRVELEPGISQKTGVKNLVIIKI